MRITKLFFLLITGVLSTTLLNAKGGWEEDYYRKMDRIFQHINRADVASGLLSDYGVQLVDMHAFNGVPADSNYVDMDTWKMLYGSLYTCKFGSNASLTSPQVMVDRINAAGDSPTPIAVMHYSYQTLNENAISLGYVTVANEQIIRVNGMPSPFVDRTLFAVAPKELYFDGPTISFIFKTELMVSNTGKTVSGFDVDFGDGSGFQSTSWNTPISYAYSNGGQKTLAFRIRYTDGTSYSSHTNIMVFKGTSPQQQSVHNILSYEIAPASEHSGGTIQVRLSTYNAFGVIKKPLIVAEGFDASGVMRGVSNTDIHHFLGDQNYNGPGSIRLIYSGGNLLNNIDINEYDIIYLDYNNGVDDIKRNAKLFEQVIEWVNAQKMGDTPNVVMGVSMGGLVARYALRKMELTSKNHQTWKYISVDSPHKGANIPIGIQAFVRHLEELNFKAFFITIVEATTLFSQAKDALNLLNSMAAKQMLIYYVDRGLNINNTIHNSFMEEYNSMGFPQQCQNVAISNGNKNGGLLFPVASPIIDLSYTYPLKAWMNLVNDLFVGPLSGIFLFTNYPQLVMNAIPGKADFKLDLLVRGLDDERSLTVYSGKAYIRKKLLWFIPVNMEITSANFNSSSNMLPIDCAPGGIYSIDMLGGSLPISDDAIKQHRFCFVPTVSALALNDWEHRLTRNLNSIDFFSSGEAGFYDYYIPNSNESHTHFNSSAAFLYAHLTAPPISFKVNNSYAFCGTKTIEVNNYTNAPLTWSVNNGFSITSSNNNVAHIQTPLVASLGILTINIGNTNIRKQILSNCNLSIAGPDIICFNSNVTYSIPGLPDNVTVNWEASGDITPRMGSGRTYRVSAIPDGDLRVPIIRATITSGGINPIILKKELIRAGSNYGDRVGRIEFPEPRILEVNREADYGVRGINWDPDYFLDIIVDTAPQYYRLTTLEHEFFLKFSRAGTYRTIVRVNNSCNERSPVIDDFNIVVRDSRDKSLLYTYPNPTSSVLTVELRQSVDHDNTNETNMQAKISTDRVKSVYSVQLYNMSQQLVYSSKLDEDNKKVFDTSKLPEGTYFLNLIGGGEILERQTIIVKH